MGKVNVWGMAPTLLGYGVKPVPSEVGAAVVRRCEPGGTSRDWVAFEAYRQGAGRRVEVPWDDVERAGSAEAVARLALDAWPSGAPIERSWLNTPAEARQVAAVLFRRPAPPSRQARAELAAGFAAHMLRQTPGYAKALAARGEARAEEEMGDKVRDLVAQFASVADGPDETAS